MLLLLHRLLLRDGEHVRGGVRTDHVVAEARKLDGKAPRPAGEIEQQPGHDALCADQPVEEARFCTVVDPPLKAVVERREGVIACHRP